MSDFEDAWPEAMNSDEGFAEDWAKEEEKRNESYSEEDC